LSDPAMLVISVPSRRERKRKRALQRIYRFGEKPENPIKRRPEGRPSVPLAP
jgi:hypothetical protein